MEREEINIEKNKLRDIIYEDDNSEFLLIKDEITGSDPEDGGADHDVVIQRISDSKYFSTYYTDWDMDYNFDRDFPEELSEVFPKQITTTIYQ